jgi:hypothetical protein
VTGWERRELRFLDDGSARWRSCASALLLIFVSDIVRPCAAQCSEKPTVMMNESAAETHLLAKKYPELPAHISPLVPIQEVTVLVTVNRKGVICGVKAVEGPEELRPAAVRTVKEHWRYRPFRVNWQPVVAQFPVRVRFVLPKREPRMIAGWAARAPMSPASNAARASTTGASDV